MDNLLQPIPTPTEVRHKLPEDICAKDSKFALRVTNPDIMYYVHGARGEESPINSIFNILYLLEIEARDCFFEEKGFKEKEMIYVCDGLVAVFTFRGLYKTGENEYVASYEYMEVVKEADLNN